MSKEGTTKIIHLDIKNEGIWVGDTWRESCTLILRWKRWYMEKDEICCCRELNTGI